MSRTLTDLIMTFEMISDSTLRQQIQLVQNDDVFEVPFSINNTYINDPEWPVHVSVDDILTLSEIGEPFFYEIHLYNSPEDVLYSTRF